MKSGEGAVTFIARTGVMLFCWQPMKFAPSVWAAGAELVLVGLIVRYGSFSPVSLVLLLLLSSQSLWLRGLGWSELGLRRPITVRRTALLAAAVSVALLLAIRIVIVPFA